jgi:hypothetical protein
MKETKATFISAFEELRADVAKAIPKVKNSQTEFMTSVFAAMELAAEHLICTNLEEIQHKQICHSVFATGLSKNSKLFAYPGRHLRNLQLTTTFENEPNKITPREFGALYEYYSKRTDLAAYYSSADVAKYISSSAIGLWLLEHIEKEHKSEVAFSVAGYLQTTAPHRVRQRIRSVREIISNNVDTIDVVRHIILTTKSQALLNKIGRMLDRITVLDPTCGCGAFYFAALDLLLKLNLDLHVRQHRQAATSSERRDYICSIVTNNLFGVDLDKDAIKVIRLQIQMFVSGSVKIQKSKLPKDNLKVGDALTGRPYGTVNATNVKNAAAFDWSNEFSNTLKNGGFDVIVGNPPYLEFQDASSVEYAGVQMRTVECRDLYALTLERCTQIIDASGVMGFIVPISAYSSPRFKILRTILAESLEEIWISSYANRPAQLFKGAQKRLNILIGKVGNADLKYHTSEYIRWKANERPTLFQKKLNYVENPLVHAQLDFFPKCGTKEDVSILKRLVGEKVEKPWAIHRKVTAMSEREGSVGGRLYFTRAFGYFLYFLNFRIKYTTTSGALAVPSEYHSLCLDSKQQELAAVAILNSSLFYWYMSTTSDCRNINATEVQKFPIHFEKFSLKEMQQLSRTGSLLMNALKRSSYLTQKSGLKIQTFDYLSCLDEIRECDEVVCRIYGLSEDEKLRVMSFDSRYRFSERSDLDQEAA